MYIVYVVRTVDDVDARRQHVGHARSQRAPAAQYCSPRQQLWPVLFPLNLLPRCAPACVNRLFI